jgi:hypothetical protein
MPQNALHMGDIRYFWALGHLNSRLMRLPPAMQYAASVGSKENPISIL